MTLAAAFEKTLGIKVTVQGQLSHLQTHEMGYNTGINDNMKSCKHPIRIRVCKVCDLDSDLDHSDASQSSDFFS